MKLSPFIALASEVGANGHPMLYQQCTFHSMFIIYVNTQKSLSNQLINSKYTFIYHELLSIKIQTWPLKNKNTNWETEDFLAFHFSLCTVSHEYDTSFN